MTEKKRYEEMLKVRERQIAAQNEKITCMREENDILSAYLMLLLAGNDKTVINKKQLAENLGRYEFHIENSDECYIVTATEKTVTEMGSSEA